MPPAISVELTNHCNLKCPECLSGSGRIKREKGYMDISLFEKIFGELQPYLYNANLYFQGEPLMHPQFHTFLEKARGIHTVVSTNGHFLTPKTSARIALSGLSRIIVSLDGLDQETYSAYRVNGNLETVKEGIRNISEAVRKNKSPLKLEIQMLVSRHNEHQVNALRKFASGMKADLRLKSMQVLDMAKAGEWMPSGEKYRRYRLKDGAYGIRSRLTDRCFRMWLNPVITWDGKVLPCCFDKDADHVMGSLKHDSFSDIWHGSRFRIFRKSVLSGRYMIDICKNCTSGLRRVRC